MMEDAESISGLYTDTGSVRLRDATLGDVQLGLMT